MCICAALDTNSKLQLASSFATLSCRFTVASLHALCILPCCQNVGCMILGSETLFLCVVFFCALRAMYTDSVHIIL